VLRDSFINRFRDIDFQSRMLAPKKEGNASKHCWVSFYITETEKTLIEYLENRKDQDPRLFPISQRHVHRIFGKAERKCGVHITPQLLRDWFCCELGNLGVQDRYVNAFCGRVPKSVLTRHYTDYGPERLKKIYEKANLEVLSEH